MVPVKSFLEDDPLPAPPMLFDSERKSSGASVATSGTVAVESKGDSKANQVKKEPHCDEREGNNCKPDCCIQVRITAGGFNSSHTIRMSDPKEREGATATTTMGDEGSGRNRFLGIMLAFIAALMYSLSALIIKVLKYHAYNLGVWRFTTMIIITIPFLIHGQLFKKPKKPNSETSDHQSHQNNQAAEVEQETTGIFSQIWPPSKTTGFLIMQAILGSNSIMFVFFGLTYLNVGDSIVIGTSAPVFVTIIAWAILKERCGVIPVALTFVALVGVVFICKPPILTGETSLNPEIIKGVAYSLASMLLLTFCYVLIRYLRKVHHALIQFSFALWGLIQSGIMGWILGVIELPSGKYEVILIVTNAFLAFIAQTCITLALKYEQAGVVALVRTTEVIFCYFWQALVLHVDPDLYSLIGALITLSCVVVAALRKTVMSLEDGNKYKKIFGFLLF